MNKTIVTEILVNKEGRVAGAIGVDTSEDTPEMVVFQAKAELIAAGSASRLYPGITRRICLMTQAVRPIQETDTLWLTAQGQTCQS